MNSKKIKGFTLVELIVVIAIITILAGIMSLAINGFRRDAKIETMNENAKMVYTAFQDILIDCEIKQDKSLFDPFDYNGDAGDIKAAWVFFRISDKDYEGKKMANAGVGLGDEIHINTQFAQPAYHSIDGGNYTSTLTGLSVWKSGTTQNISGKSGYNNVDYSASPCNGPAGVTTDGGAHIWEKFNTALTGRIDTKMEGTYCVQIDLENYEVKSVVCRDLVGGGKDPKTGLWDKDEVSGTDGIVLKNYPRAQNGLDPDTFSDFNKQGIVNVDYATPIGGDEIKFPLGMAFVRNLEVEVDIANKHGVYVGCYPFFDNVYEAGRN